MFALLLLPILLMSHPLPQNPLTSDETSPVVVISFKWLKDRQPAENAVTSQVTPQPEMIPANRNFERQRRVNASAGERDPNADSLDGRSAELDRIVQASREAKPVDGFSYQVRLQNASPKLTQTIFWEYQFTESANPTNVARRRFVCTVKIKPQKDKDLQVFSMSGPSNVINVKSLSKGSGNQFQEAVVIDRVEYTDGSFWQRKDWNLDDVKSTGKTDRAIPSCRSF